MTEDLEGLARSWWEAHRLANGTRDERTRWQEGQPSEVAAAWNAAREVVESGGQRALEFVLALLDAAPDDSGPTVVGAGPLEDIIVAHGSEVAELLDKLARTSKEMRLALSSVWLEVGVLDPAVSSRLSRWIPAAPADHGTS